MAVAFGVTTMGMAIKMRTVRPTVALKRPAPFGAGRVWKAIDCKWREFSGGREHIIPLATGMEVPAKPESVKYFYAMQKQVESVAKYYAMTGQTLSQFYVYKGEVAIGDGFFHRDVTLDDVPYFFTKLKAQGLDGYLHCDFYSEEDHKWNIPNLMSGLLLHFDTEDARLIPAVAQSFDLNFRHWERDVDGSLIGNPMRQYLSLRLGETMPQHFATMFYAKRAMYAKVLATGFRPEVFRIYNVRNKMKEPTPIWEIRSDNRYWIVGEIVDGEDGVGGYYTEADGVFDYTPSATTLAHLACRLAAQGRWMALVPHERDNVSPDTLRLISSRTDDFEISGWEVWINPTIAAR
ncbi:hypothetical protein KMZ68_23340 [Bradyrhizobium sediminis]|uniref:Uncharacterized protein n=1 Tax=Bradyrhizobium sediminis TaxID=2840469 RepID=A0A975RSL1_9BRAD|nr:hypothetical protein [Bradyrhizobium sediminis]QWG17851.1 hypothetical protein KMZ68_23340 [Bradyrhizobium sediminis]